MFKLLTEEEKQKVRHGYVIHRAIIILCALILVLVVGIIGLLPSYVLSGVRHNEVLVRTRFINRELEKSDASELQIWLKEIKSKLQVLASSLDIERPSESIEKILNQKNTGVNVTSFSWLKTKDKITLKVSGVARDRQSLITFENSINASHDFSEVTLPISNLAKDRNIDYQIKFSPTVSVPRTKKP